MPRRERVLHACGKLRAAMWGLVGVSPGVDGQVALYEAFVALGDAVEAVGKLLARRRVPLARGGLRGREADMAVSVARLLSAGVGGELMDWVRWAAEEEVDAGRWPARETLAVLEAGGLGASRLFLGRHPSASASVGRLLLLRA